MREWVQGHKWATFGVHPIDFLSVSQINHVYFIFVILPFTYIQQKSPKQSDYLSFNLSFFFIKKLMDFIFLQI